MNADKRLFIKGFLRGYLLTMATLGIPVVVILWLVGYIR